MKNAFLILFINLFLCTLLSASKLKYDALINLGGDCQVAYQMKMNGLRKYSLPFDKLITPFDSLRMLLENRFDGFMELENFEFVKMKSGRYILDKKYGTRFLHDFKLDEEFQRDYESIKKTYLRRIARLFKLLEKSEYPIFIRQKITKEQAISLKSLLHHLRPKKPFLIIALDSTEEMKDDWHEEGIFNYYLREPVPYTWTGDDTAWIEIFHAIGFPISSTSSRSPKM